MRLPGWFPQVRRPWNPAYRDTWAAMTKEERQWSLLVDLIIGGLALAVFFYGFSAR